MRPLLYIGGSVLALFGFLAEILTDCCEWLALACVLLFQS